MKYLYSEPNRIKSLQHDDLGFSDSLSHTRKGEEVAGHKYISRKWINGKWQYIYNKGKKALDKLGDKLYEMKWNASNALDDAVDKTKKTTKKVADKVEDAVFNAKYEIEDKIGFDDRGKRDRAQEKYLFDRGWEDIESLSLSEARDHLKFLENAVKSYPNDEALKKKLDKYKKRVEYYEEAYLSAIEQTDRSRDRYKTAESEYYKTPLGKLEKGKNTITKIFSKLKKRYKQ